MHDGETTSTSGAGAGDDEQAEALSRAAREAVRQPADPRLERSFARLGLFADPEPPPAKVPRPARSIPTVVESPPPPDIEPLRLEIAGWRSTADDLNRRLAIITWVLAILTATIGLLAVVLIVRG